MRPGIGRSVHCHCDSTRELYGGEAETYAREHLRSDGSDIEAFSERLRCPDTGARWRLEYPERTETDAGQARLRIEKGPGLTESPNP